MNLASWHFFFFFQAEDGIRDYKVTGVQTCALPIYAPRTAESLPGITPPRRRGGAARFISDVVVELGFVPKEKVDAAVEEGRATGHSRSEEHTSELQSPCNLVCRLLLEKKKKKHHRLQHLDDRHGEYLRQAVDTQHGGVLHHRWSLSISQRLPCMLYLRCPHVRHHVCRI